MRLTMDVCGLSGRLKTDGNQGAVMGFHADDFKPRIFIYNLFAHAVIEKNRFAADKMGIFRRNGVFHIVKDCARHKPNGCAGKANRNRNRYAVLIGADSDFHKVTYSIQIRTLAASETEFTLMISPSNSSSKHSLIASISSDKSKPCS